MGSEQRKHSIRFSEHPQDRQKVGTDIVYTPSTVLQEQRQSSRRKGKAVVAEAPTRQDRWEKARKAVGENSYLEGKLNVL